MRRAVEVPVTVSGPIPMLVRKIGRYVAVVVMASWVPPAWTVTVPVMFLWSPLGAHNEPHKHCGLI